MALTQPLLHSTAAFDATKAHDFEFFVVGGSQVVANTLTIKTNPTTGTPQQVYKGRQVTYKFTHTLPAGTLTNGTYYQATLTTEDAAGNVSTASLPIQFGLIQTLHLDLAISQLAILSRLATFSSRCYTVRTRMSL